MSVCLCVTRPLIPTALNRPASLKILFKKTHVSKFHARIPSPAPPPHPPHLSIVLSLSFSFTRRTQSSGRTLLHLAVDRGDPRFVALLLHHRPNFKAVDALGETAFMAAARANRPELARTIKQHALNCPPAQADSNNFQVSQGEAISGGSGSWSG